MNAPLPTDSGGRMWSGRFDRGPDEIFDQFQRSFSFDRRLMAYEIAVDRAWAHAIEGAGILTMRRSYKKFLPRLMQLRAAPKASRHGSINPPRKTCTILSRWL